MKQITKAVPAILVAACLLISGCETTGSMGQSTKEGAAGGAILGGLLGALVDSNNRLRGALIGAGIGGLAGGVIGKQIDKRKAEYASTEDFYDAQIEQTALLNRRLSENNRNLHASLKNDQKKIDTLVARYKAGKVKKNSLVVAKQDIEQRHAESSQRLKDVKSELEIQKEVLAEMQQLKDQPSRTQQLQTQVAQLEHETADLEQMVDLMASQSATVGQYL